MVESEVQQDIPEFSLIGELDYILQKQLVVALLHPAPHLEDNELDEKVQSFLGLSWKSLNGLNDVLYQNIDGTC